MNSSTRSVTERQVQVITDAVVLQGDLSIPDGAQGIVLFAHGSGSSRKSPRNRAVAQLLHAGKFATLLLDLLTAQEEAIDVRTRHYRFDIALLARRLVGASDWIRQNSLVDRLNIGLFGASTGAAAALVAASQRPDAIKAVVSRGGRPDLAGLSLAQVKTPTLMIVGANDQPVVELNKQAMTQMSAETKLTIIPGASHLFEEPGALEKVSQLARQWFERYLIPSQQPI